MKFLRSLCRMQTAQDLARKEWQENARAIFEADKAALHQRHELAYLIERREQLRVMGVAS